MRKRSWSEIHPGMKAVIVAGGLVDAALKAAALRDLAKRPDHQVHGSKAAWGAAITLVNAFGAAPLAYFACHGMIPCPVCKGGKCRCGCKR